MHDFVRLRLSKRSRFAFGRPVTLKTAEIEAVSNVIERNSNKIPGK